jgi:hypothetical protein
MMPGGYPSNTYEKYDRDSCACGCGRKAKSGLQPRFFDSECRQRWIDRLAILDPAVEAEVVPALELQDEHGDVTGVVTFDEPVTPEQVEQIRDDLTERTERLVVATEVVRVRRKRLWERLLDVVLRRFA